MKTVCIITPTIGSTHLPKCVESVKNQNYKNVRHQIVIDGHQNVNNVLNKITLNNNVVVLSENVGSDGWYGHRVYAAFSYLVNEDYICFLDEDNYLEPNHIEDMVKVLKNTNNTFAYSFRNIIDEDGKFICRDNWESLGLLSSYSGYYHIDTSCYCVPKELAVKVGNYWYNKWGADRIYFDELRKISNGIPSYSYSLNYRLGSSPTSPKKEFFLDGNKMMEKLSFNNLVWK